MLLFVIDMSFQGLSLERGEVTKLLEIKGAQLVGLKVKVPFSLHGNNIILPITHSTECPTLSVVCPLPLSPNNIIHHHNKIIMYLNVHK
jgi:hypothetical protein